MFNVIICFQYERQAMMLAFHNQASTLNKSQRNLAALLQDDTDPFTSRLNKHEHAIQITATCVHIISVTLHMLEHVTYSISAIAWTASGLAC